MISSASFRGVCPVCSTPGRACGADHMRYGPIEIPEKGDTVMADPIELREYTYMIGNMPVTAMLTEELAERYGAKPVAEGVDPSNPGTDISSRQAVVGSSSMRTADDAGVVDDDESVSKSRAARNKRA